MAKKIISITEGRKKLFKIVEEIQKPDTYYSFTVGGKPQVVLMSQDEFDSIMETMKILSDPEVMEDLKKADEDFKKGRYSSWEEVQEKLGLERKSSLILRDKPKRKYGRKKK